MVDLGEFKLTNSFVGGGDIMEERGLHPLSTNSDAKAILDKMVIQSSAIEVYCNVHIVSIHCACIYATS